MHYFFRFLLLLLSLAALYGSPAFQDASVEVFEEEVYLSLRYQGVIDEIVIAYYTGRDFYLPLTGLFDIFAINYEFDPASLAVKGFFLHTDNEYILDFTAQTAVIGGDTLVLNINDYMIRELDFFLSPKVFRDVFGIGLDIDLSRLSIGLKTDQVLPIIQRQTERYRQEQRQLSGSGMSSEYYELIDGRDARLLDGALFDYSLFSTITEERKNANLNLNVGGELLYGDIQGTLLASVNQDTGSVTPTNFRWRYAHEVQPWFSTVTLGQQSTVGLTNMTFQGVAVTNQSLVPRRSYDTYVIDGTTDPEAEVELYQDGRLLEVIQADDIGYYRFMIPLNYGTSEFNLRIYGKQGRVIDLERRVQVPFQFLPQGEIQYNLAAGRIASESLDWHEQRDMSTSDISMGLTGWLTGSLGIEYFENSNRNRPAFNSKLSSRIAGDILVNLESAFENYYRLSVRGVGPNTSTFSLENTYFQKTNIYNPLGLQNRFQFNLFAPFHLGSMRFTGRTSVDWKKQGSEDEFKIRLDVNQFIRGLRLRYGLIEDRSINPLDNDVSSELIFGAVYLIPRLPSIKPLYRGTYVRADVSYNRIANQIETFDFQYLKQLSTHLRGEVLGSFNVQQQDLSLELGLTWDLDAVRASSTVRSVRSTQSFSQTLRGSGGLDRTRGEFIWDSRQQVGRSGVSIRMFEDYNNSGTFDIGESIIKGNAVTLEGASSRVIMKSGRARLTQLQPYRRYNFRINEARIIDPLLVASIPKFSIVTDPNQFKQIDVPFYTTGVIEGRVDRLVGDRLTPISGLRLFIRSLDDGSEAVLRTFADGSFYSMEVRPGAYQVWIDNTQLEFLGANSIPEMREFQVNATAQGDFIEGLNFILQ